LGRKKKGKYKPRVLETGVKGRFIETWRRLGKKGEDFRGRKPWTF